MCPAAPLCHWLRTGAERDGEAQAEQVPRQNSCLLRKSLVIGFQPGHIWCVRCTGWGGLAVVLKVCEDGSLTIAIKLGNYFSFLLMWVTHCCYEISS